MGLETGAEDTAGISGFSLGDEAARYVMMRGGGCGSSDGRRGVRRDRRFRGFGDDLDSDIVTELWNRKRQNCQSGKSG